MATKNISILIFLMLLGTTIPDITKDREECVEQLVGLSVCLPYVGGESKAPTLDCCSNLKTVVQKSIKCLCILVKDRNDPDLGLKINATLALNLPDFCKSPINATQCIELLHIPFNAPEAKIFVDYANMTKSTGSAPSSINGGNATSTASLKNDGGRIRQIQRLGMDMICGVLLWCFAFNVFYTV